MFGRHFSVSRCSWLVLAFGAALGCTASQQSDDAASETPQAAEALCRDLPELDLGPIDGLDPDSVPWSDVSDDGDVLEASSIPEEARVPDTMCAEYECPTAFDRADACAWAAQADAVVVARITGLDVVEHPAIGRSADGSPIEMPDCKLINPALAIAMRVEHAMSGAVEGDITLRVGAHQLRFFEPPPHRGEDGSAQWTPTHLAGRGPLRVGQRVVVGMHVFSGGWSLMGDTILGVGSDGRVHVPERKGDCLSTDPIGVDGFLLSAVASKMGCKPNSVDAAERRTR